MSAPHTQCQPGCDEAPATLLRGWAKAYRDTPEHRFPSDPHAEFFPVDMDFAADTIATLQARVEELTRALEAAREEIVVAIAFIGRDLYSDRINDTADSLHTRLSKADADARRALAPSLEDRK